MTERYWIIGPPEYTSDHVMVSVNGLGEHRHSMPGVDCDECGDSWAGQRILPCYCPQRWRSHHAIEKPSCISASGFAKLKAQVEDDLRLCGEYMQLRPGDRFQPATVQFGLPPGFDFLWPIVGTAVVPPRVKEDFESERVTGISFCEVMIESVGDSEPSNWLGEAQEPEDLVRFARPAQRAAEFGPLFEMVVLSESGSPPGVRIARRCTKCGYVELDTTRRQMALTPRILPKSTEVFFLGTTMHIVVVEKVAEIIRTHKLSNVQLTEIPFLPDE